MDDDAAAAPSGGETATACASPNGDVQVQPAAPPAEEIVAHDEGSDLARRVGEGLERIRNEVNEALQEQMRSFAQLLQSETLQLSTQIEGLHADLRMQADSALRSGSFRGPQPPQRAPPGNTFAASESSDFPPPLPPLENPPWLPVARLQALLGEAAPPSLRGLSMDRRSFEGRHSYGRAPSPETEGDPTASESDRERHTDERSSHVRSCGHRTPPVQRQRRPRNLQPARRGTEPPYGEGPRVERVPSDRLTLTSNPSGIHSLGGLDELTTDSILESFGLVQARSTDAQSMAMMAPLTQLRAFWRHGRPTGSGAAPSSAPPQAPQPPRLPSRQPPSVRTESDTALPDLDSVMTTLWDGGSQRIANTENSNKGAAADQLPGTPALTLPRCSGAALAAAEEVALAQQHDANGSGIRSESESQRSQQRHYDFDPGEAETSEGGRETFESDSASESLPSSHGALQVRLAGQGAMAADAEAAQRTSTWFVHDLAFALGGITAYSKGSLSRLHSWLMLALIIALVVIAVMRVKSSGESGSDHLYFDFSACCLSAAALLSVLFLRGQRVQGLLGPYERPLETYAKAFGFSDAWSANSRKQLTMVIASWAFSVLTYSIMSLHLGCRQAGDQSFAAFAIFVTALGILSMVLYCTLHVCCALELAIDRYCLQIFQSQVASNSIAQWNVLQALLRRAAHCVEGGFVAAGTGVLCVAVLTFTELVHIVGSDDGGALGSLNVHERTCLGLWAGWVVPPMALLFYTVFRAAAITEQCYRVPALVNSWIFEEREIDHQKQYVVQYIVHSSAGFYVKGIRLNSTLAFKMSYLSGVLFFTMLTQRVLKSQ